MVLDEIRIAARSRQMGDLDHDVRRRLDELVEMAINKRSGRRLRKRRTSRNCGQQ
jgi:hypothetical protein